MQQRHNGLAAQWAAGYRTAATCSLISACDLSSLFVAPRRYAITTEGVEAFLDHRRGRLRHLAKADRLAVSFLLRAPRPPVVATPAPTAQLEQHPAPRWHRRS